VFWRITERPLASGPLTAGTALYFNFKCNNTYFDQKQVPVKAAARRLSAFIPVDIASPHHPLVRIKDAD